MSNNTAIANNFSKLTLQGMDLIDLKVNIPALVRSLAGIEVNEKTEVMTTTLGKGKHTIFYRACEYIKSISQWDKPRLPDDVADAIRDSIKAVILSKVDVMIKEYAEKGTTKIKENHLGVKFKGNGNSYEFKRATVTFERRLEDQELAERKFANLLEHGRIEKKLSKLLEKTELNEKEKIQKSEFEKELAHLEKRHKELGEELKKANVEQK